MFRLMCCHPAEESASSFRRDAEQLRRLVWWGNATWARQLQRLDCWRLLFLFVKGCQRYLFSLPKFLFVCEGVMIGINILGFVWLLWGISSEWQDCCVADGLERKASPFVHFLD